MGSWTRRRVLGAATTAAVPLLGGCGSDRQVSRGHLYVENRLDGPARIAISVTEESNGEDRLVHNEYRIPEGHALRFEEVLESGNSYDVRAFQPNVGEDQSGQERLSVGVETCEEGDPADKLDVSIFATDHGPDILAYDCDRTYDRNEDLRYVDPSEYDRGGLTSPIPTPTPQGVRSPPDAPVRGRPG